LKALSEKISDLINYLFIGSKIFKEVDLLSLIKRIPRSSAAGSFILQVPFIRSGPGDIITPSTSLMNKSYPNLQQPWVSFPVST
jgi:hypothetical protein